MTIRFFILQTHYRSTLDFSNEALQAADKGLKRLWEAFEALEKIHASKASIPTEGDDPALSKKVRTLIDEFDLFMNDDFNTAKVLANMFELAPVINSIKDGHIEVAALGGDMISNLYVKMKSYLQDVFGLKMDHATDQNKLSGVLQLLVEIRKDARAKKDFMTSDKIRNQLQQLGIQMKDEKDGSVRISFD
jgi:cysteinyl-tRNA synthetase